MYSLFKSMNPSNEIPAIPDYIKASAVDNTDDLFIKLNNIQDDDDDNTTVVETLPKPEEEEEEEDDNCSEEGRLEEEEATTADVLNSNDEDEINSENKIYILSVNGIPYYYENTVKEARTQMLNIANHFVATLNGTNGPGHIYVTDNNLRKVRVIAPYHFLMLTYNHVIHELTLDYTVKL